MNNEPNNDPPAASSNAPRVSMLPMPPIPPTPTMMPPPTTPPMTSPTMTSPTMMAPPMPTGLVRLLSWSEFERETVGNADQFFWEGMIPSTGVVFMVAEPMAGKTALCTVLAAAAHEGANTPEVAGLAVEERRFLFVMLEHGPDLKDYVRRTAKSFGLTTIGHCVTKKLDLGDEDMVNELNALAASAEANVIVIDCLRRATDLDENVSGDMADVGRALRYLTRDGERLVIAIHHLGKDGSVRGSTDLTAQADSVLTVRKRGGDLELHSRHHGAAEQSITIRLDFSNDGLAAVMVQGRTSNTGPGASAGDVLDAVYQAVANRKQSQNAVRSEARRLLKAKSHPGVQNSAVDDALRQLAAMGRIVNRNQGNNRNCDWALATPPPVALPQSSAVATPTPQRPVPHEHG